MTQTNNSQKTVLLTRQDNVGAAPFDSVAWAFSEHVKKPDLGQYHFAILHGNEDAPKEIAFYAEPEPRLTSQVAWRWRPKRV